MYHNLIQCAWVDFERNYAVFRQSMVQPYCNINRRVYNKSQTDGGG